MNCTFYREQANGFLNKLIVESITGGGYKLVDRLVYLPKLFGFGIIIVPCGFETDFASVPRFLRLFIDNDDGDIRAAAVLHDYLYSKQSSRKYSHIDRKQADDILREAMLSSGALKTRAYSAWLAVRLFGWIFYKGDKYKC